MPDGAITLRAGERRKLYGEVRTDDGSPVTITGATFQLYKAGTSQGAAVTCDTWSSGPSWPARAYRYLDTTGLTAGSDYVGVFRVTGLTADGVTNLWEVEIGITITAVP